MKFLRFIMPAEVVLVVFAALAFALLHAFGVTFRYSAQLGYVRQLMLSLDTGVHVYVILLVIEFVRYVRSNGRRGAVRAVWIRYSESYLSPGALLITIRLINVWVLTFLFFMQFKHLVPHVNGALWDDLVSRAELAIFGGKLLGERLNELFGPALFGTSTAETFGKWYLLWYPYFTILFFVLVVSRERARAHEFCCAFSLAFFLGVLAVFAFPTWGPIYSDPARFPSVVGTEIGGLQHELWLMKLALDANPADPKAVFLISGVPSLHLAVTLVGTYYLRAVHWTLFAASICFTVMTFLSTLCLGWHFLLDDAASVLLAVVSVLVARHVSWTPWIWRTETPEMDLIEESR